MQKVKKLICLPIIILKITHLITSDQDCDKVKLRVLGSRLNLNTHTHTHKCICICLALRPDT